MVEATIYIEKIGGISGKRIMIRFVEDYYKDYIPGDNFNLSEEMHTLFIEPKLLDKVVEIVLKNKNQLYQKNPLFGASIKVSQEYLFADIVYKDGKIIKLDKVNTNELKQRWGEKK